MDRRVRILEQRLGRGDECGPLVLISSNSWSNQDQDAWARSKILHDQELHDALVAKYTDTRWRPCRCARRHFTLIDVPAPAWVEEGSEDARAQWRARRA
jgi:hypothetical protein